MSVKIEYQVHVDVFIWLGVVHYKFLPQGQAINRFYCLEVLRQLRERVQRKRPKLWRNGEWVLYHDNALAHPALICDFCTKNGMAVVPQPPHYPDLATSDFFISQARVSSECTKIWHNWGDKIKIGGWLQIIPEDAFSTFFQQCNFTLLLWENYDLAGGVLWRGYGWISWNVSR